MIYFEDIDTSLLKQKTKTEYFQYVDTNFTSVPPTSEIEDKFSPLSEYYIAPYIFKTTEICIIITLTDYINLNEEKIRRLLGHFLNVRIVTSKSIPIELRLQNLKNESKEMFDLLISQKKINPFIMDLYHFHGVSTSSGNIRHVKLNSKFEAPIYGDLVTPNHIQEFDEIWNHIKGMYSDKKYVQLYPNWLFSNQLLNSNVMKYFSKACNEVYLCVDNTTLRVNELILSNDENS
ncbi:hypothetical protein BC351_20220 [Paenibacillus ferrarius]|uniref:Uncharacterized protein n=1 Tax=Paenibacillus ferrarius TaxID=1469647 RepID=A0A1V4HN45_9BACL|nr:hypothetical protein [Paenibacillus ferrarius]OPH59246.1 hypothetical protein BC351_20220 [Paenibacillus ferrarius]